MKNELDLNYVLRFILFNKNLHSLCNVMNGVKVNAGGRESKYKT